MAITYMGRVAAACILSTSGDRSFSTVTLAESTTEYVSGEVVVAEYEEAVAASGDFDTPTGLWVKASSVPAADLDGYAKVEIAFLVRATDASEGEIDELVVDMAAEIRTVDTTFGALSTPVKALVSAAVKAAGIKLR
ncbi:hypothetical protein Kim5_CH00775 [Rhizobium sp. Kim5]|uniref:hypothetical protein n=1 Tax=Rhizobium sp. Kim5 TaxID=2020311 RepID=UPI000A2A3456|nr:hypothetical protein [Rhizobium sp. Kim5]ARQ56883.1 hypothetical protein Kim5_CH00775 [Rhizobium sp. Kim5]